MLPQQVRSNPKCHEYEICPDAGTYINQVAERVTADGGFGLIIDYGHGGTRNSFSLRAYQRHDLVSPLDKPGEHDITADVNFGYLRSLVEDRALIFGPIDQREFLAQMGIEVRLRRLLLTCDTREDKEMLVKGYNMLMSAEGMGTRFKAMSIFPKTLSKIMGKRGGYPAGFGLKSANKKEREANENGNFSATG